MTQEERVTDDQTATKADARREQVLSAARRCFSAHGFHATSILRISQEAGMSPGHIYHYFLNKEAIIAGIVEQNLTDALDRMDAVVRAGERTGIVEACLASVDGAIALQAHPDRVSLDVEIVAEAARNPAVAQLLRDADAVMRRGVVDLLRRVPTLEHLRPGALDVKVAIMNMLFEGLTSRSVRQPDLDLAKVRPMIKKILRDVFEDRL